MLEYIRKPIQKEYESYARVLSDTFSRNHGNVALNAISDYLKTSSGKSLRPTLVLLSSKLFGPVSQEALYTAAALELLHISSLLHDDVVDESDRRRSRPTVNELWGNKSAILVGDFYLTESLSLCTQTRNMEIINRMGKIGAELARGELVQLDRSKDFSADEKTYYDIIEHKTASLFSFASSAGAVLSSSSPERIDALTRYGRCLGMIFQIKDDIFDYTSSPEVGKPLGSDLLEGKLTLPLIYALNQASEEEKKSLPALSFQTITPTQVDILYDFAIRKGGINYAENVMDRFREEGVSCLSCFPDSEVKEALTACLDFAFSRTR